MANTYLDRLGALRQKKPPVGWDDSPYKVTMSPDILNDPAFSEYDLSQLRTYDQDPRLRDATTLGDRLAYLDQKWQQHGSSGYTYMPSSPYNPNKVYIGDLDKLKMAVGPGAEQKKQGDINKEIASTIAHEFRHTMFDKPEYQGIIEAAYNRFGGAISKYELEEMITRAADTQIIPGHWIGDTLDEYQDDYNQRLIDEGMPAHLTPMNTTKQFHRSAREFFNKVRQKKLKKQQLQNFKNIEAAEAKKITTGGSPSITQTGSTGSGRFKDIKTSTLDYGPHTKTKTSSRRHKAPGGSGYGPHTKKAGGGIIDKPLMGRSRDI